MAEVTQRHRDAAREWLREHYEGRGWDEADVDSLARLLAEAEERERERCAKEAEKEAMRGDGRRSVHSTLNRLAAALRSGEGGES